VTPSPISLIANAQNLHTGLPHYCFQLKEVILLSGKLGLTNQASIFFMLEPANFATSVMLIFRLSLLVMNDLLQV
jgi:hypothetical protein